MARAAAAAVATAAAAAAAAAYCCCYCSSNSRLAGGTINELPVLFPGSPGGLIGATKAFTRTLPCMVFGIYSHENIW